MSIPFQMKEAYVIDDLINITKLLRSENGCPWDREQTHASIRNNLIEETYEACEAIDLKDEALLKEELGDILLQVVFHTELEQEKGSFNFDEVCDGICKKLILRHPHIFGNTNVDGTEQVLENWENIKQQSKGQTTQTQAIESVPITLPALMRTQKVQKRAAKAGLGYENVYEAMSDLESELEELQCAIEEENEEHCEEELGDVLFSAVNIARFLKLDAEQSLTRSTEKFIKRFAIVESLAKEQGLQTSDMSPKQLDILWKEAKKRSQK